MNAPSCHPADSAPSPAPFAPPPPASVRYNDWPSVPAPDPDTFVPERAVSVIVPAYRKRAALALTLAGLERQDWPRHLLQVVVVDDGSEPPIEPPPGTSLPLRVIRQPRRGFGLARARNTGVKAAEHDILVFLDADVIAEAGLIRAHARWHQAVGDALTMGFCAHVSPRKLTAAAIRERRGTVADLLGARPSDPSWLERHMARTGDFTSRHTDLFRAVTGNNFAISRSLWREAGGFDESFTRYGGEDTEFGWRVQTRGGLLVPVREAFGWHQGRWLDGREDKRRHMRLQAEKLADLIPDPGFRSASPAWRHTVPRFVVTLVVGAEPVSRVVERTETLLAGPGADLAVCIDIAPSREAARIRLWRRYMDDPRVRVHVGGASLDVYPASPLHVLAPVAAPIGFGTLRRLEAALGEAVTARVPLHGNPRQVTITRAWAIHRARRAGGTAADYGDARTLPERLLRPARPPWPGRRTAARPQVTAVRLVRAVCGAPVVRHAFAVLGRVWAEARHVRGVRTAWRFLRWLVTGIRWRLAQGRGWKPPPGPPTPIHDTTTGAGTSHGADPLQRTPDSPGAVPDAPLGVTLAAFGPRARNVFAASGRVLHDPGPDAIQAILADTAEAAAGVEAPAALLDAAPALAVPAFDPALENPIGWIRHVENRALRLGPRALLPPGVSARRAASCRDRAALMRAHHLEDAAGFHADAVDRASTLARIAARGLPVRLADSDPALEPLLGTVLHRLMNVDVRDRDAAERETLSIAQRREALRTHSLFARARQVCRAAGAEPPAWPRVSVLLATCRPPLIAHAVASVARSTYPGVELVLALHGSGFRPDAVDRALADCPHPAKVLRVTRERSLGAVLAAAAEVASGALLAKMDDDDVYGPEHLWDLVLAHGYSGASLVGKFPATVYLAESDRTARTREVPPETWSRSITGGTMLIGREALERAGGWRDAPRHVDKALVDDVLLSGGTVYRTHGAGYLLVRHGRGHTWRRDDADFLAGAESVRPGWHPRLAGLDNPPPPRPSWRC